MAAPPIYLENKVENIFKSKTLKKILFNDEHLAFSALKIEPIIFHKDRSKYLVSWTIEGEITPPIFAGYLALLHKIILSSALEVGLKNLQSQTAINAPDEVLPSNESIL